VALFILIELFALTGERILKLAAVCTLAVVDMAMRKLAVVDMVVLVMRKLAVRVVVGPVVKNRSIKTSLTHQLQEHGMAGS
jgi:hypothetical protein